MLRVAPASTVGTFELRGQVRGGKNNIGLIVRNGKILKYPNASFSRWRDDAVAQLMAQKTSQRLRRFDSPCEILVDYVPGDARRRDVPAIMDALCHALERAGIVSDDSLLKEWVFKTSPISREPKVVMIIEPLEHV